MGLDQIRNLHGSRPKPQKTVGNIWTSNPSRSRPEAMSSIGAGTREPPLREQARVRDICGTGHGLATSEGAYLKQ